MRESEIHFSRWIFESRNKNWINNLILSFIFHTVIFLALTLIKPKKELAADSSSSSIKINFSNLEKSRKKNDALNLEHEKKEIKKNDLLVDSKKDSKSPFSIPSIPMKKTLFEENKDLVKNNMNSFLPTIENNLLNNRWNKTPKIKRELIENQGDIPIEGPSLAPSNERKVIPRYDEKDMSLFQFTQQFRQRFSAVWNSEDRMVPPSSPLHPGDIVYYKIFINSHGNLEKFLNLSKQDYPQKDFSDVDKLFSQVVSKVFPMIVPPKFADKNLVLTETIAIQVVDKTMPAQFSF